ncbi:hypothetical protein [Siminovitchia fortis]|nr:hypothetical protein [Siminovitchia fortis]
MRAIIYSLGIGGSICTETNRFTAFGEFAGEAAGISSGFYLVHWPLLASSFDTAGEQAKETAASQSSGSSSTSGGVGGRRWRIWGILAALFIFLYIYFR